MGRKPDILLLATADWDHPLWTNKHMSPVLWQPVDIACCMWSPWVCAQFSQRVAIGPGFGSVCCGPFNRPGQCVQGFGFVLRWFSLVSRKAVVSIESLAVECNLGLDAASAGFAKAMVVDHSPLTLKFLDPEQFSLCVYHAVDAVQEQPCMPRGVIERQERLLCAAVDQVFVTSPQLRRQLTPVSRRLRFDPNVVDQEHFATAMAFDKKDLPSDLAAIPEPRVGFIGAISTYKLDVALVLP